MTIYGIDPFRILRLISPTRGRVAVAFLRIGEEMPADPLTYGLRALRNLLLRGAAPQSAYADWIFLATFTIVCGMLTKVLFRREV